MSKINAQHYLDSEYDTCGTVTTEDYHLNDPFFGNNQALVDLLIENGVNISENYLNTLDERIGHSERDKERFSPESTVYYIPVKVWVYRNDNGTGNVNTAQVQQVIDELNNIFEPVTNIQFYRLCDINFVNNSNYANNGNQYFDDFTLINKIPGALNVHFIIESGAKWAGRANFPILPFVSNNPRAYSCAVKYMRSSFDTFSTIELAQILAHEVGHTLGLYHTHSPGRSPFQKTNEDCGDCYQESVSRSKTQGLACVSTIGQKKCEVNGDYLCDTPADPFLGKPGRVVVVNGDCYYNYGQYNDQDNWGDTWIPDVYNVMSYSWLSCIQNFSLLQTAKMYYYTNLMGINHTPFAISGNDALCAGQTTTFTVNSLPGVSYYHWEVSSNLTILSGQGTTSVTVQATNHGGGELTVTPNCGNRPVKKTLTQLFSAPVSGPDTMCVGAAPKYYSTTSYPGASYNWLITNGAILNGQGTPLVQVSVSSDPSNISELYVAVSYCGAPFWGNKLITHVYSGMECNFRVSLPDDQKDNFNEDYEFIIYPNPASHFFSLLAPHDREFTIEVADKNGIIVYKNNQLHIYETTINADAFQTGIYFIIINHDNQQQIKRLIIKK